MTKKTKKLFKAEVSISTTVTQYLIEDFIRGNPVVFRSKKLSKHADKAQRQLSKLYQKLGK